MILNGILRRISHTKALDEASGKMEIAFFEPAYRLAYLIGMSSSDTNLSYLVYSGIVKLSVLLFISCEIWYLFSESSSLDMVIDNINVTIIHLIALYRYKNMMDNKNVFKKLAKATTSPNFDISTKGRAILMQYWLQRNETYFKLLLSLGTCTLAVWYIYPLVDDLEYNLTVAIRLPLNYRTPVRYPFVYCAVLVIFQYTSYFVMFNDLIMQAHLMHLLCQFTVLADCFENIIDDCDYGVVDNKFSFHGEHKLKYLERLGKLVDQHNFILDHTMELRNVLSSPMLGQLLASSMLICFAGYQVTATVTESITKFFMSFLYLSYNMFELFIFCRWCDEIKFQSDKICQAVYFSGWELGLSQLPGVKSRLMLVMVRASKPVVLTAGGLYDLSLSSYTTLVKTSYSALTVLLRLRHN